MVVAFTIRRPWPKRQQRRYDGGKARWRLCGAFWVVAGRTFYWPALITIWHVEPKGRDAGTVCKHHESFRGLDGKWHIQHKRAWRWHVWHWRIQISPLQSLRAFLFDRCALCRRKGRPNVSFQWDGPRLGWWKLRSRQGVYHSECSSLVSLRRQREDDEVLIRQLFAALRIERDQDENTALLALNKGLEFRHAKRLTKAVEKG